MKRNQPITDPKPLETSSLKPGMKAFAQADVNNDETDVPPDLDAWWGEASTEVVFLQDESGDEPVLRYVYIFPYTWIAHRSEDCEEAKNTKKKDSYPNQRVLSPGRVRDEKYVQRFFATQAEAIIAGALETMRYHEGELEFARRAVAWAQSRIQADP